MIRQEITYLGVVAARRHNASAAERYTFQSNCIGMLLNRSVFLNVQYNKNLLLNREFRVTDFSDIIPVAESGKYQLSGMIQPESISDSTVSFRLGYYIPDTDLGYPIMLTVTKEGKVLTSLIDEGELGED